MKRAIITLFTILPVLAFGQSGTYTIKGKLTESSARDTVFLQYRTEAGQRQKASIAVHNGSFEFNGFVQEPLKATLQLKHVAPETAPNEDKLAIYLVPGTTELMVKTLISEAAVQGTKLNEEYQLFQSEEKVFNKEYEALEKEAKSASQSQQSSEIFRSHQQSKEKAIDVAYMASKLAFVEKHTASITGILALSDYSYLADYNQVQPLFSRFTNEAKNSSEGREFAAKLIKLKATAIGAVAPDFTQPDMSGKMIALSSLRGKYVLVDFWASWCIPCRQENPNVVKAYNRYKDQGFTVLGVSMDGPKDKARWTKAIFDDHLAWTQVSELKFMKSTAALLYGITAIPQNVLVAPDGKVIAKNLRGEDLQAKLREIFQQGTKATAEKVPG